jgi:sporulation protein YlmC with PRC-barrel domain
MRSTFAFGGLLAAILATSALAQSQAPAPAAPARAPTAAAPAPSSAPVSSTAQWRASKLIGLNVYNDQNEKLGDINEILLDQSGKVVGVVIGVGGFLGMGQHDVMVTMDKLKFINDPPKSASTTPGTTGANPNRPARASNEKWYPDHAVLSGASKDQLKAMPAFKYS